MFLRVDDDRIDVMQSIITGPAGALLFANVFTNLLKLLMLCRHAIRERMFPV